MQHQHVEKKPLIVTKLVFPAKVFETLYLVYSVTAAPQTNVPSHHSLYITFLNVMNSTELPFIRLLILSLKLKSLLESNSLARSITKFPL